MGDESNIYYVTFGQDHEYKIGDTVLDKDCVLHIQARDYHSARLITNRLFGKRFCTVYSKAYFDETGYDKYYPRGVVKLDGIESSA